MTKKFAAALITLSVSIAISLLSSCEDAPPNAYIENYVVQGALIVDEPIKGIIIQRSLPTTDTFSMSRAIVRDADVRITDESGREFILYFQEGGSTFGDYSFADTSIKIQPNTLYSLSVRMADGHIMTGKTRTPERFSWITPPRKDLQFPKDTLNLPSPDSLKIRWNECPGISEYLIRIKCIDTMGYGKYLTPPTDELNRRRKRLIDNEDNPLYYNTADYGFLQSTEVNTVWTAFKWYGRNNVAVLAPDDNLLRWYKIYFQNGNEYNPNLGSIIGGIGVFGSASQITQETFIIKNQP